MKKVNIMCLFYYIYKLQIMKNMIKKSLFSVAGVFLLAQNNFANATIGFWEEKVDKEVQGSGEWAEVAVQQLIANATVFLAILAVVLAIYGWFNILTAAGDEKKVTKGKTILIQALIWLVVIWLANSIVQWIVLWILNPTT
jgi:hypothetical protein